MGVTSTGLVTDQALDLVTRRLTKPYSVEATHDVFGKDTALLAAARAAGAQLATYDPPLARCASQLEIGTPLPLPASNR